MKILWLLPTLLLGLASCTLTPPNAPTAHSEGIPLEFNQIDPAVADTLNRLYAIVPGTQQMLSNAAGVLVFPEVWGGSIIVGMEHGRGALQVHGQTLDFYSITGASIGFQGGGQSKSVIYVFNASSALERFMNSSGWTAGVNAQVVVGEIGSNGLVDTQSLNAPVTSFVLSKNGLEIGVSVQGSKINKIQM